MMSDAELDRRLTEIDAALTGVSPNAPVAFGTELFAALVRRGMICDTLPAPIGEGEAEPVHPSAFRETHPARVDPHIDNGGFVVGDAAHTA
ncbi:MAG: hypothetical protein QM651_19590 [Rhodoblastus sp.]